MSSAVRMAANMSMKVRVDAFTSALRIQFFSFCAVHFFRRFFVRTAAPPHMQKSERQISAQCVLNTHRISHLITGMRRSLQHYQKFQQV